MRFQAHILGSPVAAPSIAEITATGAAYATRAGDGRLVRARRAGGQLQPPAGGIDFHGEAPDYVEFAYLALTIGTFQISDTDITAERVRPAALHHALLSHVFGTGIVAITIRSVSGLLGR